MLLKEVQQEQYRDVGLTNFSTTRMELADLTAEDVVEYFIKKEVKRTPDTRPEPESEVRLPYRSVLPDVQAGLEAMCDIKTRGYYLITKCLAHKAVYLLQDIPGLATLNKQYSSLVKLNGRHGGLTAIVDQADVAQYIPSSLKKAAKPGEFHMAKKLRSTLGLLVRGTGVDLYLLSFIGLGAVLVETSDPNLLGIALDIKKEVDAFKVWVRDRAMMMETYWNIAQLHLKAIDTGGKHTEGGLYG